jgi:hypothetical protein
MARQSLIAAWLLLSGAGCESVEPRICTLEARSSVAVDVRDEQDNPITDAEVVFSVDGSAEEACDGLPTSYVCGWEREGTFVITARKAGYDDARASVEVGEDEDGCHVAGQSLTLTLIATDAP